MSRLRRPVRMHREPPADGDNASGRQKGGLFLLGAAGLFLLSLLTGIYLFFPNDVLQERLVTQASRQNGIEVQIDRLRLAPLLTVDVRALSVSAAALPRPLQIERLQLSPRWATLFTGNPGGRLQARLLQGELTADWRQNGEFHARAEQLQLDLPLTKPLATQIEATLETAEIASNLRLDSGTPTRLTLRLTGTSIAGLAVSGNGSTDLNLGSIVLEVAGQGRSMQVNRLSARGGVIEVDGDGTVLIGRTAATSRLRLSLRVRPRADLDPALGTLLEMVGRAEPDGHYLLQINGTLDKPSVSFGG